MKSLTLICLTFLLSSCVGLAVGTFGTFENKVESPRITPEKNERKYFALKSEPKLIKQELLELWGQPDKQSTDGNCEVLTYYSGRNWSGIGAFVLVAPIPIGLPTGRKENRFYFIQGEAVGLIEQYTEVKSAFGYMCGSNECDFLSGQVNKDHFSKEHPTWCM